MSKPSQRAASFGRVLVSLIFVMSGVHKVTAWCDTASQMENEGLPVVRLFLFGAINFELLGGLSVMWGGAVLLIILLIPTTLIFHDFWTYEGQEQQMQMINFMRNLAIRGGLFVVAALGPGGCSVLGGKQNTDAVSAAPPSA